MAFDLVVLHAGKNVRAHIAPLNRARTFGVAVFPQEDFPDSRSEAPDAVLWELMPDVQPNMSRLKALAGGGALLSYSESAGEEVRARSSALGFGGHLETPLSEDRVSHYLSVSGPADLASRFREGAAALRRDLGRRQVYRDFVRAVSSPLTIVEVSDALLTSIVGWLPAASWTVVGPDTTGAISVIAERGLAPEAELAARALGVWVMNNSREYAAASLQDDPITPCAPSIAALAFPLICRGRTVGVLVGLDREPSREPPELPTAVQSVLLELLQPAAVALDNALRIQRVEELSVTDDLTQLYNARFLNQALRREAKRSARSRQPLSLLFIDLDGFKQVNDRHGHLYGSRVLVEVAQIIRECSRETDVAARYGGDEFAVVLPDTGTDGAMAVAGRFCRRVRDHVFLQEEGINFRLTASTGVATLPDMAASAEELIQVADEAMYRVKSSGKDGIQPAGAGSREGVTA